MEAPSYSTTCSREVHGLKPGAVWEDDTVKREQGAKEISCVSNRRTKGYNQVRKRALHFSPESMLSQERSRSIELFHAIEQKCLD